MAANITKYISITQYNEKMGEIRFPDGFEEHLKSLMPEYDSERLILDENDKIKSINCYSKECRISIIKNQIRCFGWSDLKKPVEWDDPCLVGENPDPRLQRIIQPLMRDWEELRLIVKDDMVVGVVVDDTFGYDSTKEQFVYFSDDHCLLPYYSYAYATTSDNNGAGYKTTDWSRYLVCLPYNHNLW